MSAREQDRYTCQKCGARVQWGTTRNKAQVKLEPDPTPLGRLFFNDDGLVVPYRPGAAGFVGRSVPRYNLHACDEPTAA